VRDERLPHSTALQLRRIVLQSLMVLKNERARS
jgi:hypothetical protein